MGKVLYTDFILPFEIASILFLVAMIGAVILGKKEKAVTEAVKKEIVPDNPLPQSSD